MWYDNPISLGIMTKKYLHDGETPDDFIPRIVSIFSKELQPHAEKVLNNADFLPAGRSLFGAGYKGKRKLSMSNCYILPTPEDNIESIFDTAKRIARISSYGGGSGIAIDKLRPKHAPVNNAAKSSTGAVSFLDVFNITGSVIGQQGRRAALLVGMNCYHPDIEEFVNIKKITPGNRNLESMNISVKFTNDFCQAIDNKEDYVLHYESPEVGKIEKTIDTDAFFDNFCKTNWDSGEPGFLLIDELRDYNLLSGYPEYVIDITNPCAEYSGCGGNSCNLGSINIYNMIKDPFTDHACLDVEKLKYTASTATAMLDEILDYGYNMQPLDINRECIENWRSIGLGIFGLADALIAMGIRYGSPESINFVNQMMSTILHSALAESCKLAKAKGTFKKFKIKKTLASRFAKNHIVDTDLEKDIRQYGLRNGSLLSIAPTGTISLFAGTFTGGVEPMYQIAYERTSHSVENEGKTFFIYSRGVFDLLQHHGLDNLSPAEVKAKFPFVVDTYDIKPEERIALQAAMQFFVDNSISSTINLPTEATVEDIKAIFLSAWKHHLKGVTVFRDGCARGNILGVKKEQPKQTVDPNATPKYNSILPAKRRGVERVDGSTFKQSTSCSKSMYVTVNKTDDGDIFEVFTNASGGCQANISTITRLISLCLRSGIRVSKVIEELRENKCAACQALRRTGSKEISLSCGNAIADAMTKMIESLHSSPQITTHDNGLIECPECHQKTLKPEGRCFTCDNCGYNACNN